MDADTTRGTILIYGAGDQGQVVAEAADLAGFDLAGFLDDRVAPGTIVGSWQVLADDPQCPLIVGIGDNMTRWTRSRAAIESGRPLATIVHPSAWVSPTAELGRGVFVGPNAVVHVGAHVEDGAIINSAAVVEHHCHIQAGAHVAPNATLCGCVRVGRCTLIGAGAVVLPVVTVGEEVVVGAGSVVTGDVPDGVTVVGDPARHRRV